MQNTNTKTAREIVRKICAEQGVRINSKTWTNMCADEKMRNLCFITEGLTDSVVEHIALNLNVDAVRKTSCFGSSKLAYLRIIHCAI